MRAGQPHQPLAECERMWMWMCWRVSLTGVRVHVLVSGKGTWAMMPDLLLVRSLEF